MPYFDVSYIINTLYESLSVNSYSASALKRFQPISYEYTNCAPVSLTEIETEAICIRNDIVIILIANTVVICKCK